MRLTLLWDVQNIIVVCTKFQENIRNSCIKCEKRIYIQGHEKGYKKEQRTPVNLVFGLLHLMKTATDTQM